MLHCKKEEWTKNHSHGIILIYFLYYAKLKKINAKISAVYMICAEAQVLFKVC